MHVFIVHSVEPLWSLNARISRLFSLFIDFSWVSMANSTSASMASTWWLVTGLMVPGYRYYHLSTVVKPVLYLLYIQYLYKICTVFILYVLCDLEYDVHRQGMFGSDAAVNSTLISDRRSAGIFRGRLVLIYRAWMATPSGLTACRSFALLAMLILPEVSV